MINIGPKQDEEDVFSSHLRHYLSVYSLPVVPVDTSFDLLYGPLSREHGVITLQPSRLRLIMVFYLLLSPPLLFSRAVPDN